MTPWDLQKSLIAEIEELLAQMQLKNAAGEDVFGVKGYEQRLPEITDDEEDQSQFFPYFIVRIEEGNTPTDDEPWLVGTTVLFGICDYDKETNGHRTILEMITTDAWKIPKGLPESNSPEGVRSVSYGSRTGSATCGSSATESTSRTASTTAAISVQATQTTHTPETTRSSATYARQATDTSKRWDSTVCIRNTSCRSR